MSKVNKKRKEALSFDALLYLASKAPYQIRLVWEYDHDVEPSWAEKHPGKQAMFLSLEVSQDKDADDDDSSWEVFDWEDGIFFAPEEASHVGIMQWYALHGQQPPEHPAVYYEHMKKMLFTFLEKQGVFKTLENEGFLMK